MTIQIQTHIKEEITNLLTNLININTTNPPGNETQAAHYIAKHLTKHNLQSEIFEPTPNRGSLITRLKGTGEKPSLLLLSHLDVVAANPKEWTTDPFTATIQNGFIYGRGAIDMKGMTAIEITTLTLLKQNNIPLKGDLVLAATADEEQGGETGAGYLLRNHKNKIWCPYIINEGGGTAFPQNNQNIYPIQTAEKGILWFKIKAKGTPGHGSTPNMADNAIERINKVITKLTNYQPPPTYIPTLQEFLTQITQTNPQLTPLINQLLTNPQKSEQILNELAKKDKALAEEIRPRTKTTLTPTIIQGGIKENIIPSQCEVTYDCRILPGQSATNTLELIKTMLNDIADQKLSYEIIQIHNGSQSTTQTPLYQTIKNVLQEADPGCTITPTLTTGGTDSRFFRESGSICYGFHPVRPEEPNDEYEKRIHGINERLSIDNLIWGTSILYETVKRFLT